MKTILFVCTANVFRSLIAEAACKAELEKAELSYEFSVASAGIESRPQLIPASVRELLANKGFSTKGHIQRLLTRDLIQSSDHVIAMSEDQQEFIQREFGREVPLFAELTSGRRESINDLFEVVPNWRSHEQSATAYIAAVTDRIFTEMPALIRRLRQPVAGASIEAA
jgi:protein-tyrosine phosphatase